MIFAGIFAVIALALALTALFWVEFAKYLWFQKKFISSYKKFKKSYVQDENYAESDFQLSKEKKIMLAHYLTYDSDTLKEMRYELKSRISGLREKSLISFLLTSCLPVFSVVIAVYAIFSKDLLAEHMMSILLPTGVILLVILLVSLIDFSSQIYIEEPINIHFAAIEEALRIKEETLRIKEEAIEIKKNQQLHRENRLNRRLKR